MLKTSPLCKVVQHTHTHQQMLRSVLLPATSFSPSNLAVGQCCCGDYAHSAVEFLLDIMYCCNHHPPPHVAPQGVQEVSDTLIQVREETLQETHQGVNMEVETTHATEICTI